MRGLHEQLLVDMQEQQAKASELKGQLQQVRAESQEEIGRLQATLELDCLRSADAKLRKWEARKERLV